MTTMNEIVIIPMNESHLRDVAQIESVSFSTPWSENLFALSLADTVNQSCFTALVDGKVGGYIILLHYFDEGELLNIATSPEMRKNGIAKKLMDKMISVMKEKEINRILLEVRESNVPAKTLYESYGFSSIAVRKNYYSKPTENAIVMEKHI